MRLLLAVPVLLFAVALAAAQVCAGPYRQLNATPNYTPSHENYQQPTHRRRVVNRVEIISDVLQVNPAYLSAYSEGYDSATQADIMAALRTITARMDAQDKAILAALVAKSAVTAVLTPGPTGPTGPAGPPGTSAPGTIPPVVPPPVPSAPGVPPLPGAIPKGAGGGALGLAVITAKCAACHQAGKLAPDQRFTLLDAKGNLSQLTDRQKLKVMQRTYAGTMPPPQNSVGATPVTDADFAAINDLLSGN
jgi:hypothetical protein